MIREITLQTGAVLAMLSFTACIESGDGNGPGDQGEVIGEDPEDVVCESTYGLTGTVTQDPADGCVPLGTWTLSAVVSDAGTCSAQAADYEGTYTYEVTGDIENGYTITYLADPANQNNGYKIQSAGGTCLLNFEHYSPDGTALFLIKGTKLDGQTTLGGNAYLTVFRSSQI